MDLMVSLVFRSTLRSCLSRGSRAGSLPPVVSIDREAAKTRVLSVLKRREG